MLASRMLLLLLYLFNFCSDPVIAAVVVPNSLIVSPTASDLFQIGDSTTGGACSEDRITTINAWLTECVDILNAALTAYHGASTSSAYRNMFSLWLSMKWDKSEIADVFELNWYLIGKRLAGVATFLSGGGLTGGSGDMPYLFCGDTFAQKKE
ncbi:hypothetical protein BJX99DRAFT_257926 [Aspergillus californicus]